MDQRVDEIVHACQPPRAVLFAHSLGAVPAVLAAASGRIDLAGLVLVEPALYDAVRGDEAIERHIAIVSEARDQAVADLRGFWMIFRPLMFGGPFDPETWATEQAVAEHWAFTTLPWGHGVRANATRDVSTLVITGCWNPEYEVIAQMLEESGARHRVISGTGHRPQDHPNFAVIVEEFLTEAAF